MGIELKTIKLLSNSLKFIEEKDSILVIGKQDVFATYNEIEKVLRFDGYSINNNIQIEYSVKMHLRKKYYIDDITLFKMLGYLQVDNLDISNYEGANILCDLNVPLENKALLNKYDFIIDIGNTEHMFNISTVLNNYELMLKHKGYILHMLPSNNYVDHGYYQFSPNLFEEYYRNKCWPIHESYVVNIKNNIFNKKWYIYEYENHKIDELSMGKIDDGMLEIYILIQKSVGYTKKEYISDISMDENHNEPVLATSLYMRIILLYKRLISPRIRIPISIIKNFLISNIFNRKKLNKLLKNKYIY